MEKTVPKSEATLLQEKIDQLLPNDLHNLESPSIYLNQMRAKADIDAQKFAQSFHPQTRLAFRAKIFKAMVQDPDFRAQVQGDLNQEQIRDLTNQNFIKLSRSLGFKGQDFKETRDFFLHLMMTSIYVAGSIGAKVGVHYGLYCTSLDKLGTEKHQPYLMRAYELRELGCFAMTEVAHGSNLQGMLTTATYIHSERAFIINTPHELGMKYWIGNLAKFARYGVVFANLVIEGKNYGIHVFLVELRDSRGNLKPGITAGDVGSKLGMNGVDNGWCIFRRVKVPYDALLDRFSQITTDGQFVSQFKKKSERFASQLSALSSGRLAVAGTSIIAGYITGGIALRYLSVRKQFGEQKFSEDPLITYPLVIKRLIPPLCELVVLDKMIEKCYYAWISTDNSRIGDPLVKELHAACSMLKYLASHKGMEISITARELTGGHGYSEHSRIPDIIKDQNIQSTWEGANDVLVQQASKFLLSAFRKFMTKGEVTVKSLEFLHGLANEERIKRELQMIEKHILSLADDKIDDSVLFMCVKRAHQLRLKAISDFAAEYFTVEMQKDASLFNVFNKSLPDHLIAVSVCWGHYISLENFEELVKKFADNSAEKRFLQRVLLVFGIASLRQFAFYLSGTLSAPVFNRLFELERLASAAVVPNLLVFLDQELPPDELLNSTIGCSTGEYFQAIVSKLYNNADLFGRSNSWDKLRKF